MKSRRAIWIPYADVMAALVLVFILLIIFFAINNEESEASLGSANQSDLMVPVSTLVLELYSELDRSVVNKYDEWGIRLLDDLTITFENPVVLFEQDSHLIKQEFQNILDEWTPVYFSIVAKDKYRNIIKEVKIEGHTARKSPVHNSYIRTVELSQHRARSILDYIMRTSYFQSLPLYEQNRLEYMVSANGFGYGRAIDDDYVPVIVSGKPVSHKSRRVLFKVIIHGAEEDIVAHIKRISN